MVGAVVGDESAGAWNYCQRWIPFGISATQEFREGEMTMEDSTCLERMTAQHGLVKLMFDQIGRDIHEIKVDIKEMKTSADGYVTWGAFQATRKELEEIKRFVWKVTGGLAVIVTLIGFVLKFLK